MHTSFSLVLISLTLNGLERRNDRRRALSAIEFVWYCNNETMLVVGSFVRCYASVPTY